MFPRMLLDVTEKPCTPIKRLNLLLRSNVLPKSDLQGIRGERYVQCSINNVTRVPTNTKRTTTFWLSVLRKWYDANGHECDSETITSDNLAPLLEHAYAELRTVDRKEYAQSSLQCFRSGIHRELANNDRRMTIFQDKEFKRANAVLDGVIKRQRRQGVKTTHKPPITDDNMAKLTNYLANCVSCC